LLELILWHSVSRNGGLSVSELALKFYRFHQRALPELTGKAENLASSGTSQRGEVLNDPEVSKALRRSDQSYDHYSTTAPAVDL